MVVGRLNRHFRYAVCFLLLSCLLGGSHGCKKDVSPKNSTQNATMAPCDFVDPVTIQGYAFYTDGGTLGFCLKDAAGRTELIAVDRKIDTKTYDRIYVGGHPDNGRLTSRAEGRAYIKVLRRAVEVYTPAQISAMAEEIQRWAVHDPHPMKEIAYVVASRLLVKRLGRHYEKYRKNHPSHEQAARTRENEQRSALRKAIEQGSDGAIFRFIQMYPDSKLVSDGLKHLNDYLYSNIKERRLLPYEILSPSFRDGRKRNGPGGSTINSDRMDLELVHCPWPKSTHFSRADNLGNVGARRSVLYVATGGRIIFEQWARLGGLVCKGTVEFEGEGLALLPDTEVYLPKDGVRGMRPDGGWLFESDLELEVWVVEEKNGGRYCGGRRAGTTPSEEPIVIPICAYWWVKPVGDVHAASLYKELKLQGIPGLELGGDAEDHVSRIGQLAELRWLVLPETEKDMDGIEQLTGQSGLILLYHMRAPQGNHCLVQTWPE